MPTHNFDQAPFIVIWEVTRACALACVHCRADAIPRRDPRELSTEDGYRLIDQIAAFGAPAPLLVLTGGDPMWRRDLADLVRYGTAAGLSVAVTPSGTAAVTRHRLQELRDAGVARIAVSFDAPEAEVHDDFRGVRGSFHYTTRIIEQVVDLGLPLQINTTVSRCTLASLPAMADRLRAWPLSLWAVFFLVQVGRGAALEQISADECEQVLRWLRDLSGTVPFGIKTTEAPHYRRVLAQSAANGALATMASPLRTVRAVNDGNGLVFIDHVGSIQPSGFLPLTRGNIRSHRLVDVYRTDALFRRLRDGNALEGRCGRCEFRDLCGGSRSRAFAATGNAFGSDPLCAYRDSPLRASRDSRPSVAR
jgi:radical SAM protein